MTSDHGNDRRRQVDAKHEAQDELEADQISHAISQAFHRLLSVEATRSSPSHVEEVWRCRAPTLDNSGQKIDIRRPAKREKGLLSLCHARLSRPSGRCSGPPFVGVIECPDFR